MPCTGDGHGAAHTASKPPASSARWALAPLRPGTDTSATVAPPCVTSIGPGATPGAPAPAALTPAGPAGPAGPCGPAELGVNGMPLIVSVLLAPPLKAVPLIVMVFPAPFLNATPLIVSVWLE